MTLDFSAEIANIFSRKSSYFLLMTGLSNHTVASTCYVVAYVSFVCSHEQDKHDNVNVSEMQLRNTENLLPKNNSSNQTRERSSENSSPLLVSVDLTPVCTPLEAESLEPVDVFVLIVFVTSILVVTLRDAPADKSTARKLPVERA